MRLIWQAIRAVTVEVMGVGAVIFMLFSAAGWTFESAGVQTKQEAGRAWAWIRETTDVVATSIKPHLTAEQRQQFAAERLDLSSHFYRDAVGSYANETAKQSNIPRLPADQRPVLPTNQLLGTL
ncbi:MAG: hypothetical protein H6822_05530 [Planctomycetaceae bacterium]|nr:hypothetical protein [Planctomycetales bacterium]MCB9921619.1 hypothetical protein [Planctomycetaceae bacterium]